MVNVGKGKTSPSASPCSSNRLSLHTGAAWAALEETLWDWPDGGIAPSRLTEEGRAELDAILREAEPTEAELSEFDEGFEGRLIARLREDIAAELAGEVGEVAAFSQSLQSPIDQVYHEPCAWHFAFLRIFLQAPEREHLANPYEQIAAGSVKLLDAYREAAVALTKEHPVVGER